jgi:hypothetical protein
MPRNNRSAAVCWPDPIKDQASAIASGRKRVGVAKAGNCAMRSVCRPYSIPSSKIGA